MKITYHNLITEHVSELKKFYKATDRQIEKQVRTHMDGANAQERRGLYEAVFNKRK